MNPTIPTVAVLDKELLKGAVRYPTSAKLGEDGNVVLFGHSSYLPVVGNQAYKTFNEIQKLAVGDSITVYSSDTAYTYRVRNVVKKSASDGVIELSITGRVLTLVTCSSFGAKEDRFVVTADFVESHSVSIYVDRCRLALRKESRKEVLSINQRRSRGTAEKEKQMNKIIVVLLALVCATLASLAHAEFKWQHFGADPYASSRDEAMRTRESAFSKLDLPKPVVKLLVEATQKPGEKVRLVNGDKLSAMMSKGGIVHRNVTVAFAKPPVSGRMENAAPAEKWQGDVGGKGLRRYPP